MSSTANDSDVCWSWLSCNVKSLKGKISHFKQSFANEGVVALQEVHTKKWQEARITQQLGFDDACFSSYGSGSRGAALLWRKPWTAVSSIKVSDDEGRIAGAILSNGAIKVGVVAVYAPNVDNKIKTRFIQNLLRSTTVLTILSCWEKP